MQAWLHPLRPTQPIHVLSGTFVNLKKTKSQKKKGKREKIPSIFGVNINLAVRSEYANAFLIGPNLHSLLYCVEL